MKEHPIIFSAEMVRAILDGRKTQTRRIIKPQPPPEYYENNEKGYAQSHHRNWTVCPYGQPKDRLWVRENIRWHKEGTPTRYGADGCPVMRDGESVAWIFNEGHMPSIHMPRWASRITLEITDVRVERLIEISGEDLEAEGFRSPLGGHLSDDYAELTGQFSVLWDSLNAKRGFCWDTNPWVWVISFKRIEQERTP